MGIGEEALLKGLDFRMVWGGLFGFAAGSLAFLFLERIPEAWLKESWEDGFERRKAGKGLGLLMTAFLSVAGIAAEGECRGLLLTALTLLTQAAACDVLYQVLPDQHTVMIAVLGMGAALLNGGGAAPVPAPIGELAPDLGPAECGIWPALWGGLLCLLAALCLWLPELHPRGKALLGLGDVKLFGALGILAGSWAAGLQILLASFVIHGILCGAGLLSGRLKLQSEAAMGPAICLAAALVLL
ncbi:MAG: hypothetical protein E7223_07075 [Clostridiales bacterium]|nr:hypothetical protein [Clostridiales bacterium]